MNPFSNSEILDEIQNELSQFETTYLTKSEKNFFNNVPLSEKPQIKISYVSGNGDYSERILLVIMYKEKLYSGCISAYCAFNRKILTFRFDRIKTCKDLKTGKEINLYEYIIKNYGDIGDYLSFKYSKPLSIFYYVAKADGQCRKEEKEVIGKYFQKLEPNKQITSNSIDEALKKTELFSSIKEFKRLFNEYTKKIPDNSDLISLIQCCRDIIHTQKTIKPEEKEILDFFDKSASIS